MSPTKQTHATMNRTTLIASLLCALAATRGMSADIEFENSQFRAVLGDDGVWKSLIDKTTGKECCAASKRIRFADARVDGVTRIADGAALSEGQLTVSFGGCDTRLVYAIGVCDDWISFELTDVLGARPSAVTLLNIGVTVTERGGSRLNAAWNDHCAICLRTINLQAHGTFSRRGDLSLLSAKTQDAPGPPLEGAGAALIVAAPTDLKPILSRLAKAFDLPQNDADGIASRDLPTSRQSYWFLSFGEKDVDQVIEYCRKTGLKQVMLNSGAWCTSVGHFTFNTAQYPDGIESLRRTVARFHDQGILVGMHTFASKVSKKDAHVSPIPSDGFCVDMTATLAGDIAAADTEIRTSTDLRQWPGSPVCKQKVWEGHVSKHQEVVIDDEIVRFESIGPDGRWDTFQGCQRGTWGTRAAAHKGDTECRHFAVDGCINGYILDQDSPLFDETTSRLADIFNDCDFDMVYFDGSEDVDRRRYHYYSSNAHAVAMRKFKKRPLIHMGGGFTHGLWHSFTRSGTIDQYPGTYLGYLQSGGVINDWPTCKDHIDRSVRRLIACQDEMTPAELGWFGIGPKSGNYDGLQFDEIEYLMCKSLAFDAPISLQTTFSRMEAHPLTPDILELIRQYECVRSSGDVPQATRQRLEQMGCDFLMLPTALHSGDGPAEFVAVEELAEVAGAHDLRGFIGEHENGVVASLWQYRGRDGQLILNVPDVKVYDIRGEEIAVKRKEAEVAIPIGHRRLLLHFPGQTVDSVSQLLSAGIVQYRKPVTIWLEAEDHAATVGTMVKGAQAGIQVDGALGDVVLCRGSFDRSGKTDCYAEYRVQIPRKARWTLWARVLYPTGGDMSFGLVLPDEEVTLSGRQVIGNCGVNDKRWHWTGRGGGVTTVPPGSPIIFDLEPGPLVFRIYPREGGGTLATNPRLDCFCLSEDLDYRPTDDDAKAALGK